MSSIPSPNRRAILTGLATFTALAGSGALAIPSSAAPPQTASDPILVAIRKYKAAEREYWKLYHALDEAHGDAHAQFGSSPSPLISWRGFSAIGAGELDSARDEFLGMSGADPSEIKAEYLDAKKRVALQERKAREWDRRVGLTELHADCRRAQAASEKTALRMARTMPTTPAGAAALIAIARIDLEIGGGPEWPFIALKTAAKALKAMEALS